MTLITTVKGRDKEKRSLRERNKPKALFQFHSSVHPKDLSLSAYKRLIYSHKN